LYVLIKSVPISSFEITLLRLITMSNIFEVRNSIMIMSLKDNLKGQGSMEKKIFKLSLIFDF